MAADDKHGSDRPGRPKVLRAEDLPPDEPIRPAKQAAPAFAAAAARPRAVAAPPSGGGAARLALDADDRLPWLESPDDDDDDGVDTGRVIGFLLLGIVALALIVGTVWWVSHAGGPGSADGSLVRAEPGPYKVRPNNPGGKTFEGTGDTSYEVSEGKAPSASLAEASPPVSPTPTPSPSASASAPKAVASAAPSATPSPAEKPLPGVGVQIGAYMDRAAAEAGWTTLLGRNSALSGRNHRVVEGRADIGTVYRLQALAGTLPEAQELCRSLKAGGLDCQVKR